jgi:phenylacetate-CoA ligase
LVHEALRRIGACVLPLGPQQVALAAEFIVAAGATGYVGTASHLKLLLQAVDALPPGPSGRMQMRLALAGAEPFGDDLRCEIEKRWGVPCLDFYGTAESGIVALECEHRQGMHLHPAVLAETVTPGTGERSSEPVGELLLTADADELPLLRFATGDLVRLETGLCECGRTAHRVRPLGRVGDSARVRGMLLHTSQLRAFARRCGLASCRMQITRDGDRDVITLRFRGAIELAALAQAFHDVCRLRADGYEADPALPEDQVVLQDMRHVERAGAGV